jgi:hypothetical protein
MSLASVGKATAFGCTVVSTITRLKSECFAAPVRVAVARLSWITPKPANAKTSKSLETPENHGASKNFTDE